MKASEAGIITAGLIAVFLAMSSGDGQEAPPAAIIEKVRSGRTILLCRHAITSRMNEREPVDYADSTTQRLLSPEGEEQAHLMGRALRALEVPIRQVIASPMHRARRTAEKMFGDGFTVDNSWHTNGPDFSGPPAERRDEMLRTGPAEGTAVIISHIGTMRDALGEPSPARIGEGDCVAIEPLDRRFRVLGVVPWRAWLRAAG